MSTTKTLSQKHSFNLDDMLAIINSVIGSKASVTSLVATLIGSLTGFITSYVWDSSQAVYALISLMLFDWVISTYISLKASIQLKFFYEELKPKTKIALKKKKFNVWKFIGVFGSIVVAFWLLGTSWNISKANPVFFFLPNLVYGAFAGAYLFSLFKNLTEVGFFSKQFLEIIKDKLKIKNPEDKE